MVLVVAAGSLALAADLEGSLREALQIDLVEVRDGRFHTEVHQLCQVVRPAVLGGGATRPFLTRVRASAPADGLISRDVFVALVMELSYGIRIDLTSQLLPESNLKEGHDALRCKLVERGGSELDLEMEFDGDQDGVQTTIVTKSGQRSVQKHSWEELVGSRAG